MLKQKCRTIMVALACAALSTLCDAQCGQWTTKTLSGPEWKSPNDHMYMAYDENLQKLILFVMQYESQSHEWTSRFWTYEGTSWELLWDGFPTMDPGWYFEQPFGMEFDQNQKALVIFSRIFYQLPENECVTAYKFVPGQGWERIFGCTNFTASHPVSQWIVTYDTLRKRAIIIGAGECTGYPTTGEPITVEFDGWNFNIVYNPPDYKLYYGSAGFNPETGKVVFYGYGRELDDDVLETFEYDGITWTLVETSIKPENQEAVISGLIYSPRLHGLLAIPSNWDAFQTWLYQDSKWVKVYSEIDMPARLYGILQWDILRKLAVYWGGRVKTSDGIPISKDTLEFKANSHCRPVARPSSQAK